MKKILILVIAIVLTFTLVSCGNSNNSGEQSGEVTVKGTISEATEDGFTLTLDDSTTITFESGSATRVLLEDGFVNGAKVSVMYSGDAAAKEASARTLLLVEEDK